jgi:signal transduction histidine kinase
MNQFVDAPYLLSEAAPTRDQKVFVAVTMTALASAVMLAVPYAQISLVGTEVLLPAYAAAIFFTEIVTACLLLALFSIRPSRGVLILAAAYLFSGTLVVPWALTFPGVFVFSGFDPGLQSTATIAAIRRIFFPAFVICYALTKDRTPVVDAKWWSTRQSIVATVVGVLVSAVGLSWMILAAPENLPQFMSSDRDVSALWRYIPVLSLILYAIGLTLLWLRRRSLLDLWLMVVLSTLAIEIILLSYVSGGTRLTLGWWTGRVYGLTSASIVLIALLSQTTTLQSRLARSIAAERRMREARLTAMEALSASIAHEINQPLASMVTNADAGLRWIGKAPPDFFEAEQALKRIVSDGHRAGTVVSSIRSMFRNGARQRMPLDLNIVIDRAIGQVRPEASLKRARIESALEAGLPPVFGAEAQLQQVLLNLISNALESLRGVDGGGSRIVRITSRSLSSGEVLVAVSDTGAGVDPDHGARIFEPFFTTKPDGMGIGLMICRSIVEAEGGRLWVEANEPRGTVFSFTLPAMTDRDMATSENLS